MDGRSMYGCVLLAACLASVGNAEWQADAELLFQRFGHNDGVISTFDYDPNPRITIGYATDDGVGLRGRWWNYAQNSGTEFVDTFTIDLEVYRTLELSCDTRIEFAGGLRYTDFEWAAPGDLDSFTGLGGTISMRVMQDIRVGTLYGGMRWATLVDDHRSVAFDRDVVHSQSELAIGYETERCLSNGSLATFRAGYEWWHWNDMDLAFDTDVSFSGFVVGLGLDY